MISEFLLYDVKWVPCYHGITHPQDVDGGDSLQIWLADNIQSKQLCTGNKGWPSSLCSDEDIIARIKKKKLFSHNYHPYGNQNKLL
jgi:hypothetical protein